MKSITYRNHSGQLVTADEAFDDEGYLKAGFTTRVPLVMRDAMRQHHTSAQDAERIVQHHYKTQALALADAENKVAYLGRDAQVGDHCILDGKPAVLVKDGKGDLVAQPLATPTAMATKDAEAIKNAAYDAYNEEARNEWRNPAGLRR